MLLKKEVSFLVLAGSDFTSLASFDFASTGFG
jgi:hypothetical protein